MDDGLNEAGNIGLGCFHGRLPAEFAQSGAGDGADGNGGDPGEWECDSGVARGVGEMRDCRRAGEGRCVDSLLHSFAQKRGRGFGHDVAVGVDDIDCGAGGAKSIGDNIAGDGGASEENSAARNLAGE